MAQLSNKDGDSLYFYLVCVCLSRWWSPLQFLKRALDVVFLVLRAACRNLAGNKTLGSQAGG